MPGMNGIELLDLIRKTDPRVKRFLISAFEVEDFLVQNCGCVDKFLQKPISMVDLIKEVQSLVQSLTVKASH
jgi:YesN/AraC family two-component response regulator